MDVITDLKTLPVPQRLQLVEDLWDSIALDQEALPDHPTVMAEIKARRARFSETPSSGKSWEEVKTRIRSGRV